MCLQIPLHLPPDVEARVRREVGDLEGAARESVLLDLFRRDVLSVAELGAAMGLDRFETYGLLKRKGIFEGVLTSEDVDRDVRTLERLLDTDTR